MASYINFHTHQKENSHCISIYNNRFLFDSEIYTEQLFSIGIHPYDCNLVTEQSLYNLEFYLNHNNCKAIGECGLDKSIAIPIHKQLAVFDSQLQLALKFNKPVIIHCVKAFDELIEICQPFISEIPLIIHGFNKSIELAQQLIAKGFQLSLHPSLILKKDFLISELSIEKLFFETDSDTSISIEDIYKEAAIKLKISEYELQQKIYSNFINL